jgi:hypothetical protein
MFDMKTSRGLKYAWLIYLFLVVLVTGVDSNASGMISAWEPFKAKTELASYVQGIDADIVSSPRGEFMEMDRIISIYHETADKKDENLLNGLKIHNVMISFSHVLMDQMKVDIRQLAGNESDKVNTIKSLPSMFLNSPHKDTLESLGKIFEPQVNLSIEV